MPITGRNFPGIFGEFAGNNAFKSHHFDPFSGCFHWQSEDVEFRYGSSVAESANYSANFLEEIF